MATHPRSNTRTMMTAMVIGTADELPSAQKPKFIFKAALHYITFSTNNIQ